jgi:hypothetical protein
MKLNNTCWVFNIGKFGVKTYLFYSRKERTKWEEYYRILFKKGKSRMKKNIAEY